MQTHQIKNHMMSLTVAEHGAEITSIQLEGIERMWDADPAFWGRTAPVLFSHRRSVERTFVSLRRADLFDGTAWLCPRYGFLL